MMQCPKCKFEQPTSETCTNCGIIFSRYKEAQERKTTVAKEFRPSPPPQNNIGNNLLFYSMCFIFLSIALARAVFFIEFPVFLDPYFRLLMMGALIWLSFGIIPRAAALFARLDKENYTEQQQSGLKGFNIYDKKAIFIFSVLGLLFWGYVAWALLSGSIDCFAGRNRTCHEVYDSIADPGEYWVTALVYYIVGAFPTIAAFNGLQERRDREKL